MTTPPKQQQQQQQPMKSTTAAASAAVAVIDRGRDLVITYPVGATFIAVLCGLSAIPVLFFLSFITLVSLGALVVTALLLSTFLASAVGLGLCFLLPTLAFVAAVTTALVGSLVAGFLAIRLAAHLKQRFSDGPPSPSPPSAPSLSASSATVTTTSTLTLSAPPLLPSLVAALRATWLDLVDLVEPERALIYRFLDGTAARAKAKIGAGPATASRIDLTSSSSSAMPGVATRNGIDGAGAGRGKANGSTESLFATVPLSTTTTTGDVKKEVMEKDRLPLSSPPRATTTTEEEQEREAKEAAMDGLLDETRRELDRAIGRSRTTLVDAIARGPSGEEGRERGEGEGKV